MAQSPPGVLGAPEVTCGEKGPPPEVVEPGWRGLAEKGNGGSPPMGGGDGESGRVQAVGGANGESGRVLAVGGANEESVGGQAMGGATGVTPPMGGATGGAPPMGGVSGQSGRAQEMGGTNGDSGQVLGVGGASVGTPPMGGATVGALPMGGANGESGRSQVMAGANGESGRILELGGASVGIPPMGGAAGGGPPVGGATRESGRGQLMAAANEGGGRILGVGGASVGTPPMGVATGQSGRDQEVGGATVGIPPVGSAAGGGPPMGGASGESGRVLGVGGTTVGTPPMGGSSGQSGRDQTVGGATVGIPPVGGAAGGGPPMGGVSVGSGRDQPIGAANEGSGRIFEVGGATVGTPPMGGGGEQSGRAEALPGANESGGGVVNELDVNEAGVNEAALWAELEAELRRCPGGPAPPALWALVAQPAAPSRKCRFVDGAALLRGDGKGGPQSAGRTLRVLEKCGRNLLHLRPPPAWQRLRCPSPALRPDPPVIQVLSQLGYTQGGPQGRSFPPGAQPDPQRVAAVTAELLLLRTELELLLANKHPNPHLITPVLEGTREEPKELLESDGDREEGAAPHATPTVGGESPPGARSPWLWPCTSCTFLNVAPAVLCAVCERPRLAPRPPPAPQNGAPQRHIATHGDVSRHGDPSEPGDPSRRDDISRYVDISRHTGSISRPQGSSGHEGRGNLSQYGGILRHEGPSRHEDPSGCESLSRYGDISRYEDAEQRRQEKLRRDGMRTVQMVREAESQSVPVEAVLGLAQAAGGGAKGALLRARAALGAELRLLMTSSGSDASGPALKEAAVAWIRARGSHALALQGMMGERRRKLRTLLSLGIPRSVAEPALHHVGWSLRRALPEVQRRKLRPFLSRLWEPEEPPLDFGCGDQQALARRALATLSLPSWGRATLFVAMGRELGLSPGSAAAPGLKALVEAVRSCPDRAQIRRRLRCDCAVCGWALPREQMRWLTGCECALCPECFRQHFTIGVKEKAVADLVCPACGRPDLRDEAARLCYFSTLDVQLRQELDPQTYQLFTQKLTERELLRDPQFLWCPQCSFGFIFEAERGPAQCPQCQQSCCPRCLRPWHPEHGSLSCAEFGLWLRERDPQLEHVGLDAFLRDHGIACPRCSQWFALARGGCLHFQCSQCSHHFCGGCGAAFHPRERCPLPRCSLRPSLHAHHPRHCAFHLRDWEPRRLQRLLQVGGVPYDTQPPSGAQPPPGGGCWLQELKETPGAPPRDAACGRPTAVGQAGLCRAHYAEYLVRLINERGLDPATLYGAAELRAAAERHLPAGRPPQGDNENDADYAVRLRELLAREAPVEPRPSRPSPAP